MALGYVILKSNLFVHDTGRRREIGNNEITAPKQDTDPAFAPHIILLPLAVFSHGRSLFSRVGFLVNSIVFCCVRERNSRRQQRITHHVFTPLGMYDMYGKMWLMLLCVTTRARSVV